MPRGHRLVAPALAESLAASIPGAELVIVPDCGHYPQVEQEATFNYTLEKFLGRLPTDRPAIKVS
ncbi:MAG: hypothetical protein Q7W02_09600 [Candidatus Rokubacteria bacterium]|nr:hypothetical protein [Candidatus Rokubacteria bacterium]